MIFLLSDILHTNSKNRRVFYKKAERRLADLHAFLLTAAILLLPVFMPAGVHGGTYISSAHGSSTIGVDRTDARLDGYSQGNCAHCHEQHASIAGGEPGPETAGAASFALFAPNYTTGHVPGTYIQADNFCFYCHNSLGSGQAVTNYDFSRVFGGGAIGVTSIQAAFNQTSAHNLTDIANYAKSVAAWTWFKKDGALNPLSNPCDGCHNPHLAKRNPSAPADPTLSAISKPSDHGNLFGPASPAERMSQNTTYVAPYSTFGAGREPGAAGAGDGSDMPDYAGFCTDCHNATNVIYSTRKLGNLRFIDWSATGDKHGGRNYVDSNMYAVPLPYVDKLDARAPYGTTGTNYVLSCLDCHEPHGSSNIRLIRRRVNGADLANAITTYNPGVLGATAVEWKALCERCHVFPAGDASHTGNYYLHHSPDEAPGAFDSSCLTKCHNYSPAGSGPNKPCMYCHFHGSLIGDFSAAPNANLQTRTF
ncbi:MAG: hypothetical protein A2521_05015 [Deltaproteobacteria bacterium RIFOXYD12_FULL_57_12]|nr:MAG: hypothetical protein A2521_05015 [Deltaproteobacteria bacterium RIFOXYD12_FULL_57_12]